MDAYEKHNLEEVAKILLVEYYDLVYKKPHHIDLSIENSENSMTLKTLKILQSALSSL